MQLMVSVNMRTGVYRLYGKTTRRHRWRFVVRTEFDDGEETLSFDVRHRLRLDEIMEQMADLVMADVRKIKNIENAKSVWVDVGIVRKRKNN